MSRVFIYGSCVSRDTLELSRSHEVIAYVARQSLISAASPKTDLLNGKSLDSGFQNRSLEGDLQSNLFPSILQKSSQVDVVVIDLTDERLGTFALPDGTYITHSVELQRSGRLGLLAKQPTRLNLGTERHLNLWSRAAVQLRATLKAAGLFEKTLVLRTPWATHTVEGNFVEPYRGIDTSEMNGKFDIYFKNLQNLGFDMASLPDKLAMSHTEHKWGPAPFHYSDYAYVHLLSAIDAKLATISIDRK